ncbi:MAG: hypothetical protein EXQ71_07310 [Acidimicrobiia bacterium]|nr:hypothetical protein [Acidimicrobiia bacterium]
MAGNKVDDPHGGGDRQADADASGVELQHWRDLAAERDAALRLLAGRPLVRMALGLDRRLAPAGRRVHSWYSRGQTGLRHGQLSSMAIGSRFLRRRRSAALATEMARLKEPETGPSVSVVVIDDGRDGSWRMATGLTMEVVAVSDAASTGDDNGDVRVVAGAQGITAALAQGASAATGDVLCFAPWPMQAVAPGWLAHLAGAIGGDVVAATPTIVHPARRGWQATEYDQLVRSEGFDLVLEPSGVPSVLARRAGVEVDVQRPPTPVDAAPLHCLVVDRRAYLAAGGLLSTDDDAAAVDLCVRLRSRGGSILHVPTAVVYDQRPVASRDALHRPIDPRSRGWHEVVDRHGSSLMHSARSEPDPRTQRWVITTAVPSARVAARWGDWHLAQGLAEALRRLGQDVVVQTHDQADSLAARVRDIHLVIHGLASVRRTPGQRHILWVVSHPESFELDTGDAADLILVASSRFAEDLRARSNTPVEVVLQGTDPERFQRRPAVPEHEHPVTVVAKTRNVRRRVVVDALAAGIRPAIYGSGWRHLVDPALVVADHVDNDLLPVVYSSAGVVLNDHWDTMRSWGFVSNRIFDVLACGVPIISDRLPEIQELFGAAVPTYETSADLGDLVRKALADPDAARLRAEGGRQIVLAHHTFDHRAQQIVEMVERHGLGTTAR